MFLQPHANDYSGVKGYFAHHLKTAGESTSYGEPCLSMLKHLAISIASSISPSIGRTSGQVANLSVTLIQPRA